MFLYKAIVSNVHEEMDGEMYEKYYVVCFFSG